MTLHNLLNDGRLKVGNNSVAPLMLTGITSSPLSGFWPVRAFVMACNLLDIQWFLCRRQPIAQQLEASGLGADVPFTGNATGTLTVETADSVSDEAFNQYVDDLYLYLQTGTQLVC